MQTSWYNIQADLAERLPTATPGNGQPVNPASLKKIFGEKLVRQGYSSEQNIRIPETIREAYITSADASSKSKETFENFLKTPANISTRPSIAVRPGSQA